MTRMTPDKAQTRIEQLDERMREANLILADLKSTVKHAQEVLGKIDKMIEGQVSRKVTSEVSDQLAALNTATSDAIEQATEGVFERFDKIQAMLLGEDKKGKKRGESIPDMILRMPIRDCCGGRHKSNDCPYGGIPGSHV